MSLSKEAILIIDDDQNILDLTGLILNDQGYKIHTCLDPHNYDEISHIINADDIKVLITDYQMSYLTGDTVVEQTRARYPQIGIIMLTANGSDNEKIKKLRDEGLMEKLMGKPFDLDDLLKNVDEVIKVKKRFRNSELLDCFHK